MRVAAGQAHSSLGDCMMISDVSRLVAWLGDPARLRLFNVCAAALLVASIYPLLRHVAA
ncbi:MAG: hypothetical protein NVSMB69_13500 [Novosphingobium sp.]